MTWEAYFAHPGINFTRLKLLDQSPLHFRHAERTETASLAIGRYVHAAILDPTSIERDFAIWKGERRSGKVWEAFAAENADKTILREKDLSEHDQIIRAVRSNPDVADLLADPDTRTEVSLTWTDGETGLVCKARPDIINPRRRLLADLKTTRSTDVRLFGHDIARYSYHAQLAHYSDGVCNALGWRPEQHILIAVEKSAPYDVGVFPFGADALEVGDDKVHTLLALLKECLDTDTWPGRHPKPVALDASNLPPWIFGGGIPEFAFVEESP